MAEPHTPVPQTGGGAAAGPAAGAAPASFAHLHLHTEYSLLDGGNRIDKLMDRVKELGMDAVACTDHGNMFGAVAFYTAAKERGIKPILGVEAYVALGPRTDRTYTGVSDGGYHLVLLAENDAGWRNLLVLCSEAFLTGFYYKPRIDRELLEQHSEGLIAINGHLGSEIGDHLLEFENSGDEKFWHKAVESAVWHRGVFADAGTGPRFFVELQHHVKEQNSINKHLIRMSRELGVPLVCDNDAHFLRAEDHDAHDTLVCISTGKGKSEAGRLKYPREVYVKSPGEMCELFEAYGEPGREALANSVVIAKRCNVTLPLGQSHAPMVRVRRRVAAATGNEGRLGDRHQGWEGLPRWDDAAFGGDLSAWYQAYCAEFEVVPFEVPRGESEERKKELLAEAKRECDAALTMLAEAGYVWRYGSDEARATRDEKEKERRARLERELKILCDKNIAAYFLIVWDFVSWGRINGVPALARGSGVGTMVGFVLGLSNACPVRYGLLFERFTDPDRSEYPDIDIDLCQDGRARVIDYVRQKYGHVAQIITFGTLKARAAVRDVGRVLEMPLSEVDRLAKMIPEQLGMTLERALEQEPELRKLYDRDPVVARCIDNAKALEGQARHASVHAAGVIVATRPLHEIVPLYKPSNGGNNEIVTQWDGPTCEKMGLLKMDFLGLRTISVIERAKRLIREGLSEEGTWAAVGRAEEFAERKHKVQSTKHKAGAHPLDLDRLTLDDPRVFALFARGDTTGVFQFESGGMRRLLVEMKPDRLEDLIAANALFRPGPMDLIPDYNRRKHGTERVPTVHPIVDQYTAETYGVMVYQEQVMQIVHGLGGGGGIKLRDAYTLIKNISKKKHDKIDKERPKFVDGAQKQGLTKAQAQELFELILKFAGYGFNKSHSTGYAIVAYQTAYLKTYFPNQYMAAFLTYESAASQVSDWVPYLEDCKKTLFIDPVTGETVKTGVEVRPPDVNLSDADFTVVFEDGEPRTSYGGHVRFGLQAIKGVGDKAIEAIVREREARTAKPPSSKAANEKGTGERARKPYVSMFDFCERVPVGGSSGNGGAVNKATIEALIKSGALDCLHGRKSRSAMVASIESAVASGVTAQRDKASGQSSLFGFGAPAAVDEGAQKSEATALARVPAWSESETLVFEKETLGFYVSSHPLDQHQALIGRIANCTTRMIREQQVAQDSRVVLGVCVQALRTIMLRAGKNAGGKMAVAMLEDKEGAVEAVAFTDVFGRHADLLQADQIIFVQGSADYTRGQPQVRIERVYSLEQGQLALVKRVRLTVDEGRLNGSAEAAMDRVASLLTGAMPAAGNGAKAGSGAAANGSGRSGAPDFVGVEIVIKTAAGAVVHLTGPKKALAVTADLMGALGTALGEGNVETLGPEVERVKAEPKKWERRG